MSSKILHGDCLSRLRTLPPNSVDSLVTDPPAGISFMGKDWDHHKGGRNQWIAWLEQVMRECYRVMKPGAHGLVWALPRTSHWTATALENAGFEVRDVVTHLFGSGFPKSLDVSKAIDKAAGAKRKIIGPGNDKGRGRHFDSEEETKPTFVTAPATDAAKRWQGFGTALKPASEHWILIRKPCSEKTVAANVQRWGCGALNIDGTRVGTETRQNQPAGSYLHTDAINDGRSVEVIRAYKAKQKTVAPKMATGRWPANLVLSETAAAELDRQSGTLKAGVAIRSKSGGKNIHSEQAKPPMADMGYGDAGGASRFFYIAKPSRRERNLGCEGMPELTAQVANMGRKNLTAKSGVQQRLARANHHPTVKPIALMRYLIRMVTPPNGLVLDPFAGSGTTGCAARREGMRFLGVEREREYVTIARARIKAAVA